MEDHHPQPRRPRSLYPPDAFPRAAPPRDLLDPLVRRAAHGDRNAIGALGRSFRPQLLAAARSRVQLADAEDVVQDLFVASCSNLESIDGPGPARAGASRGSCARCPRWPSGTLVARADACPGRHLEKRSEIVGPDPENQNPYLFTTGTTKQGQRGPR